MQPFATRQTPTDNGAGQRSFEALDVGALRNMQCWRDSLAAASRTEVSAALVATAFAARQLKAMEIAAQGFPENLLHGRVAAPSSETLVRLAAYVEQVNRLRFTAERSADRLTRLSAPGLEILVLSIQAVTQARQLLAEGQGLWRELVRGVADYPAVYRQLLDPAAGADEIADDLFLPAALAPIGTKPR
jgi:hypothetical protein